MANEKGYCVKCRKKVTIDNPKLKKTKNGRKMVQGRCPRCDTKVSRFVANDFCL